MKMWRRVGSSSLFSGERWNTLEPLIDAALDLDASGREKFVRDLEQRDPTLSKDLEIALAECERQDPFLSNGAFEAFGGLLEQRPPEILDERLLIEREIGRGGMATVYQARDRRHDRVVAVKVLGHDAGVGIGIDRFLREIRVAAQLQHAHIVPLYDSGEDRGWLYYVMPVMNGQSLRDRIARDGRLSLDATTQIAGEIGGALEYAHRLGIVHRDVKPENILFHDGRALLADFGIARAIERSRENDTVTGVGIMVGTPGYMSPEQLRLDGEATARSDVYALACVVYEMLTGVPPFVPVGRTKAIVGDPAIALAAARPELPAEVGYALRRGLAEDPNERTPSAQELVDSLAAAAAQRGRRLSPRPMWAASGIAAAVVAVTLIAWRLPRHAAVEATGPTTISIAVRPFDNISGRQEDEYLTAGLDDELTAALARLPGVSVIPRSSAVVYASAGSRAMGESLHVAWVLEGTLSHVGTRVLVRPTLVKIQTGGIAWSGEYDRELHDVIDVQRDIVKTIADTLRVALLPTAVASRASENFDAEQNYQAGRWYWNRRLPGSLDTAVTFFKAAINYDSTYARAYSGLADALSLRGWSGQPPRETFPLAKAAAQRALRLDPTSAEAHASLGFVDIWYDWNWPEGQREIDTAVALDRNYASASLFRAWYLIPQGRVQDAVAVAHEALTKEPLSPIINARVGSILSYAHRFPEAEVALRKALRINPGFQIASAQLARLLAIDGRIPEAIAALPPDDGSLGSFEAGVRGFVYARAGDRDAAMRQIKALEARQYQIPDAIAAIYAGLGDRDQAFAWLDKAYDAKAMTFVLLAVEPMYDTLHADPRFDRLKARVGLR